MTSPTERAQSWLDDPAFDPQTKAEVKELLKTPEKLTDAFFTDLAFGTGGLRGLMGVGTNRMNIYTVRKATQGLANYIVKHGTPSKGVVIGFDSRHHSHTFAEEAARVLAGNGIRVYLLPELRPTPFVSFAIRYLNAQAGIMITASHNPKEYNGYKAYWADGAQIVPPHDHGIMTQVEAISSQSQIKLAAKNNDLISSPNLDSAYLAAIQALQLFPREDHSSLKISYTSLHGTGITLMKEALTSWGFEPPHLVDSQIVPDGDFPSLPFPNPEHPDALKAGINDMVLSNSDLLLATDPDADRLGVVVQHQGKPVRLTGNELAALGAHFICNTLSQQNRLPSNGALVTTIVTTALLPAIAKAYKVACIEVLTGFKYIGEKIHQWEQKPTHQFLFGAEESYGYLMGTHSRDKDGIVSGCLFATIAFKMKTQGKTLVDYLHEIYQQFGIFQESQLSLNFPEGKQGHETIRTLMENLRKKPPKTLGNIPISAFHDLLKPSPLPLSNVLIFRLSDGSQVIIRPSGTEPKLKIYFSVCIPSFTSVEAGISAAHTKLDHLKSAVQSLL